jgi:hypothetical protein
MPCSVKNRRRWVRNPAQLDVYAQLDAALAKNTQPVVSESEKTRLWILRMFGPPPEKTKN